VETDFLEGIMEGGGAIRNNFKFFKLASVAES